MIRSCPFTFVLTVWHKPDSQWQELINWHFQNWKMQKMPFRSTKGQCRVKDEEQTIIYCFLLLQSIILNSNMVLSFYTISQYSIWRFGHLLELFCLGLYLFFSSNSETINYCHIIWSVYLNLNAGNRTYLHTHVWLLTSSFFSNL